MQAKASSSRRAHIIEAIVFFLILVGIVVSVIFVSLPKKEKATMADVVQRGKTLYSLRLDQNQDVEIPLSDGIFHIEIKDGKVRVVSSPCPNQTCVQQGSVDKVGESIICAHEGITISLRGDSPVEEIVI